MTTLIDYFVYFGPPPARDPKYKSDYFSVCWKISEIPPPPKADLQLIKMVGGIRDTKGREKLVPKWFRQNIQDTHFIQLKCISDPPSKR